MRAVLCLTLGLLAAGCGGSGKTSQPPARLHVSSSAFIDNSRLPQKYRT